jgi:hypothetical protein
VRRGLKSLLFGVHQFAFHPWTVARGWRLLYGRWPTFRETVCIIVHDWGYYRCRRMDDPDGERHPETGAKIVGWLFGRQERELVLYHSRHLAARYEATVSELCWPDKLSMVFYPRWLYLVLARLSGELAEYREETQYVSLIPDSVSDAEWFDRCRDYLAKVATDRNPGVMRPAGWAESATK